jgi:hypothetical protein
VVTTLVCFVLFRTRGCGCIGRPAFPTPSFFWANASCTTRAHRAAGSRVIFDVIARSDLSAVAQRAKAKATKQSSLRHSGMVRRTRAGISRFRVRCGACHRAALGADPLASPRNDGLKTACGCLKIESVASIGPGRAKSQPSSPAESGRSSIPKAPVRERKSRGVLDSRWSLSSGSPKARPGDGV